MASPDRSLNLREIGQELDRARMARGASQLEAVIECDSSDGHGDHTTSPSPPTATATLSAQTSKTAVEAKNEERPLPLCLLCLTRPPSAVLLPCCHLNLCHMCAPLLILKGRKTTTVETTAPLEVSTTTPDRVPFHMALLKATANHPKSRRLSIGHCEPVPRGEPGGEMTGDDLLSARNHGGAERGAGPDRDRKMGDDGRVMFDAQNHDAGSGAKCLICRAGVTGWLRVYTG